MNSIKLHLACGNDYREGYINVDLYDENIKVDQKFDVRKIPYPDNSVDEILALHIIEHFDFYEGKEVLKEWYRVLKPGGKLILETPDFLETCREFAESNNDRRIELYVHFFAAPWLEGHVHKFLFTEEQLSTQLKWTGFKNEKRITPLSIYANNCDPRLLLAMEAFK